MTHEKLSLIGIAPSLHYEDAGAMLDWLARVFGFEERARYVDRNQRVRQAEMYAGSSEVWLNGHEPGYWQERGRGPETHLVVLVDDVDAHHARACAAGIAAPPPTDQTWGARTYTLSDPEQHRWTFVQRLPGGYVQTRSLEEGGWKEILPARR